MEVPELSLIVSVAEVNVLSVLRTKDNHPCMASTAEHAMRGTATPASNTAVGAGTAQLPAAPEYVSYV
jgi:hypothetical protein